MARKLSLDEHWLDASEFTPEQKTRVDVAANETDAMREKALEWLRENAVRLAITVESEDGETVTDIAALEAAIEEGSASALKAWIANPEGVALRGGFGHFDSVIHVKVREAEDSANDKILEAAMEFLEAKMYRMDGFDELFHLMEVCEAVDVSIVDVIAVEKSILRHFVKLYGIDGWSAYYTRRLRQSRVGQPPRQRAERRKPT